ncbi:flagellar motor switch protein FliG [Litorivivens lipolytica]|uniref:Flagellar motor switch protein FliG n=1 Tax=Litorivivens lipolytica TaxID=1524264 RepID=A0A7W4Z5X9_9GAMM|nr:flagellar motor switch protein FliG [Litorivivens lipolytica]MBB3046366.1 flagellar motor switch protein FliG [Litorivivens lipolytica]
MENSVEISGSEQAAVLLLMMGEERAAKILQHVDYEAVEKIGAAMAGIKQVDSNRAHSVCNQFREDLNSHTPLGIGVPGYVRNLLVNTMGEQTGSTLADRLLGDDSPRELDSLRWMDPDTILHILQDEHPQIIAITLAHLDQSLSSRVVAKLEEGLQEDVLFRIATMDKIPESAMKQLQSTLKTKLDLSSSFKTKTVDGATTAAGILNGLDGDTEARILETLAKTDETMRQRLEDLMFVFGNLAELDNKGMQLLLREVTSEQLSVALKGADELVRDKVFSNMSKRAKELLVDDMESRGPTKLSDVEDAQKAILAVARQLAEDGKINLGSSSDDYV